MCLNQNKKSKKPAIHKIQKISNFEPNVCSSTKRGKRGKMNEKNIFATFLCIFKLANTNCTLFLLGIVSTVQDFFEKICYLPSLSATRKSVESFPSPSLFYDSMNFIVVFKREIFVTFFVASVGRCCCCFFTSNKILKRFFFFFFFFFDFLLV